MDEFESLTTMSAISDTVTTFNFSNTTTETTASHPSHLFTAKVVVQSVILALAIFGNSCLLFVMRLRKRHYTRMHIFIIHLCFADMLVAFFNILPQLIWEIVGEWVAGDFMCRFVKFMQVFVMYLSTYILVLTALDRRRAICNPLSSHTWTSRLVHLSVAFVYALSAILSVPQAIIFKFQEISPGSGVKNCWVHFEPEWTLQFYITTFTALVYIIPLIILVYAYVSIYYTIFKRAKQSKQENRSYYVKTTCESEKSEIGTRNQSDGEIKNGGGGQVSGGVGGGGGGGSPVSQESTKHIRTFVPRSSSYAGLTRAKLKTVKLTLVIIVAYVGCWSPFFISQLWWLYDEHAPSSNSAMHIMLLLASLNSCCNPWIYMAFSGTLTSRARGKLWFLPCVGKRRGKYHSKNSRGYSYPMHHSTTKTTSIVCTPLTPTSSKALSNGISFDVSPD